MNNTLNILGMLLLATLLFHGALSFMTDNIQDFESVPLPPKKLKPAVVSLNPTLKIDAKSKKTWTLLDLSTGKSVKIDDIDKDRERLKQIRWDLAFQRTKIVTNSGITNPEGGVGVMNLGPVDFDSVRSVPAEPLVQDTKSFGKKINKAITGWYNYRTRTHNIESKKNVYIVKTSNGQYVKIRFLNYYCSNDESDCRSMMCTREEAACLTMEYVKSEYPGGTFPPPPAQPEPAAETAPADELAPAAGNAGLKTTEAVAVPVPSAYKP